MAILGALVHLTACFWAGIQHHFFRTAGNNCFRMYRTFGYPCATLALTLDISKASNQNSAAYTPSGELTALLDGCCRLQVRRFKTAQESTIAGCCLGSSNFFRDSCNDSTSCR